MTGAAALLALAISGAEAAHAPNLDALLTRHAAVRATVVSVSGRLDVRMTHSGTAEPVPPEKYSFSVRALREPNVAGRKRDEGEETWIVECRGIRPRAPLLRWADRGIWTRSADGEWMRAPAGLDPAALKMLAVARGWAWQYLEDAPEGWRERAKVRALSGSHMHHGKPAWLLEIIPRWRFMQPALAARWVVVMSWEGLPLFSRSTDRAGNEVTVVDSRKWRKVNGLPVSHEFTITATPTPDKRPDTPDPVTTIECRLSGAAVRLKK